LIGILLHGLQGPGAGERQHLQRGDGPVEAVEGRADRHDPDLHPEEWGNSAPPITAEQVAKIRDETAGQTEPYTQTQLQAIPAIKYESAGPPAPEGQAAPGAGEVPPPAPSGTQSAAPAAA